MKIKRKLYTSVRYTKKVLDSLQRYDMLDKKIPANILKKAVNKSGYSMIRAAKKKPEILEEILNTQLNRTIAKSKKIGQNMPFFEDPEMRKTIIKKMVEGYKKS